MASQNEFSKVNTTEIGVVYDALAMKMTNTLDELFNSYTLTDEGRANIIAQSITTIIQVSSQLVQSQPKVDADVTMVGKQCELVVAQVAQATEQTASIISDKAIKETQSSKDAQVKEAQKALIDAQKTEVETLLAGKEAQIVAQTNSITAQSNADTVLKGKQADILVQQKLSEAQRTAQITQAVSEATAKQSYNVSNVQKQGQLLDKQVSKLSADTLLVSAQEDAITQQVIDNRKIKIIDVMGEAYGTVSAGGLTVSAPMWTKWFDFIATLDPSIGSAPTSVAITKVT